MMKYKAGEFVTYKDNDTMIVGICYGAYKNEYLVATVGDLVPIEEDDIDELDCIIDTNLKFKNLSLVKEKDIKKIE